MYHLRRIDPADPELQFEDPETGEVRPMTDQELLNKYSLKVLGTDADGMLICDCGVVQYSRRGPDPRDDVPGTRLSEGRAGLDSPGPCRFEHCPDEKAKEAAFHATVYRATDGRVSLRKQVRGASPPSRPSRSLDITPDPQTEVDAARQAVEGGTAVKRRVPMREVEGSDVVEEVKVIPHKFLR